MNSEQAQNSNFEGWAILEIFGHQRYAGFVSTQVFGTAVMFRIDVPELEARERVTNRPTYTGSGYAPAGSVIKEGPVQGYTKLFGVGAIYAMTPCSKEAALKAVEEIQPRPLMEVQLPTETAKQIAGSSPESAPQVIVDTYEPRPDDEDDDEDDEAEDFDEDEEEKEDEFV